VPGVRVPVLRWADAGDGYQQTDAALPYDYAHPQGRTFRLHMVRLPASDRAHKIGTVFVNFGGAGAPAAIQVREFGRFLLLPEVLARYDLVGVDPRGAGQSQPVRCVPDEQVPQFPYVGARMPVTRAETRQAIVQTRHFAGECRERNGDLLDHVGTLQFARDLDVLRAAMGDRRINLLGMSYGTFLGQVVANTFPSRTGALILDGVVDPAWGTGPRGTVSWIRENADRGSWQTLRRFLQLCHQVGRPRCAFADGGDPERKFATLAGRLRKEPLRIPLSSGAVVSLGYSELVSGLASGSGLYSSFTWATVGQLLQAAFVEDLPGAARALTDLTGSLPPGFENYTSVSAAIACADTDNPHNPHQYRRVGRLRDHKVAPYFGSRWANLGLVCTSWQGRSTERYTGPWTARTAQPVLLINTRYDPATPYPNAVRVRRLLPNSALLTVDGVGHGGLAVSSCAQEVTARYLLTGATPAPGTVCAQDFQPFEPIPTAKTTTQTRPPRASLPAMPAAWPSGGRQVLQARRGPAGQSRIEG
jgi:pimeloyl-ACP methyl ester carboxylesterase